MTKIDLRAPIIPTSTRVWRMFPGSKYRFLATFLEHGVGFLDMPGLELPDTPLSDAQDIATRLRRVEVVMEKIRRDGKEDVPTVTAHELKNFKVGRKRQRHQQAAINFYESAAPGDLIIVPDTLSNGRVLVGQFGKRSRQPLTVEMPVLYGSTPIPARRVKWFDFFPENKISTDLSRSLRNEHPFSLAERSLFLEVFSLAFSSYVFQEHHSATIANTKADYLDLETSLLGLVSRMAANATEQVDKDVDATFDAISALFEPATIEYHCSVAVDIHSEGFNRFTSGKFTPLVIAAMIAALSVLSGCDSKASLQTQRNNIEIVNTYAPADDACTASVSKATLLMLQSMDIDKLWKTCQNMKDAERRAGLRSSATASN